jgi:hypothetical protein
MENLKASLSSATTELTHETSGYDQLQSRKTEKIRSEGWKKRKNHTKEERKCGKTCQLQQTPNLRFATKSRNDRAPESLETVDLITGAVTNVTANGQYL